MGNADGKITAQDSLICCDDVPAKPVPPTDEELDDLWDTLESVLRGTSVPTSSLKPSPMAQTDTRTSLETTTTMMMATTTTTQAAYSGSGADASRRAAHKP